MEYDALQTSREFYAPEYESKISRESRVPDFRNLLFWSPDIISDASGRSKVSFYTSDQWGNYMVVIQGLCKDGRAGSKVVRFEVKKD
jgi:hypothetical protein